MKFYPANFFRYTVLSVHIRVYDTTLLVHVGMILSVPVCTVCMTAFVLPRYRNSYVTCHRGLYHDISHVTTYKLNICGPMAE